MEQVLSHRVTGEQDTIGGEEALHLVVGHADALRALRQELVGHTRIRVLFLQQSGDTHFAAHVQGGAAGISAHSDRHLRLKFLNDALCLSLRAPQTNQDAEVAPQAFAVETGDG